MTQFADHPAAIAAAPAERKPWRDWPAAIERFYGSQDEEDARLRAAHLHAVMRLTPQTMLANVGSGLLIVWAFRHDWSVGLAVWLVLLCFMCGLGVVAWRRQAAQPREMASPRAMRRATGHAASLAALWATLTIGWFGSATEEQQMTLATLVTGMIGAGGFVLSPLPRASLAYVLVFSAGALIALARAANPNLAGVAVLLLLYTAMVVVGALAAWRKAIALVEAQKRSARQEQLLSMLLHDFEQQAGEALWEIGADGRLRHVSPRLRELLGPLEPDALQQALQTLAQRHAPEASDALGAALDAGRPFRDLMLTWQAGATLRHLSISGKPLFDTAGRRLGWRGVLADVSDKVRSEQQMRRLAHSDSLTGVANRFVLRDSLSQALRQGRPLALLSIDLDHFKSVNDSHGHSTGDELLRQVAQRLQAGLRPDDVVARLGGDEFAVLLLDADLAAQPARLAARLIDSLSESIEVGSRRLRVGASIGIAAHPGRTRAPTAGSGGADHDAASPPGADEVRPPSVDELLGRADLALYAAKSHGRGRSERYTPELGALSQRRLAIEDGLREAVRRGELALHWQAKVDIGRWQVIGAEALMRWTHPALGRMSPAEFIPIAEQCGVIDELGRWALSEACRAAAEHLPGLTISVNVSPVQLRGPQFLADVQRALRESGLPATALELEITESVFIEEAEAALGLLHALRELGVRVALDDFGTGYSSLSYLRRFPFDTLKIDRSFINEVLLRDDARAIVQMIAALARTLGMQTVCEGVETHEQLQAVSEAGCDQVQGYLISRPVTLPELLRLLRHWAPVPWETLDTH